MFASQMLSYNFVTVEKVLGIPGTEETFFGSGFLGFEFHLLLFVLHRP